MTQVLLLSSRWNMFLVSLLVSIQSIVCVVAEFRLNFEKFSISPLQDYSFRCWFSNNSVIIFLEGCFSKLICGRGCHFLLYSFLANDSTSILSFHRHCDVALFTHHPIFVKDHVLSFCLSIQPECHVLHSSSLILSSFASRLNRSAI